MPTLSIRNFALWPKRVGSPKAAVAEKIAPAERKRVRCAEIGEALYEMHLDDGEGKKCLSGFIEGGAFPDQTNEVLYQAELKKRARRPEFDIMSLPPKALARLLAQGLQEEEETVTQEKTAETAETTKAAETELSSQAENKEATLSAFQTWYAEQDGPLDAINNAQTMPDGLEAQKARLLQFKHMLTIARQVGPQDHAVISRQMARMDMSQGVQDPVSFARAFIFDSPNSQISTGVSEAVQTAIADSLGIERPVLDVTTGSEMTDVFEKGVGTRTVRDPDTGELREEPVYLQPGEFETIREGQSIGLTEHGDRAMKFEEEVGDFTVILPDNAGPEDMVMYGLAGQMMSQLHDVNMAEIMFPGHSRMDRGGGVLDIRMPDDFNRTQQLCQIFYGNMAGYNGELLDQSDLDRIPYLMQFQNAKGDAVIGDVNPDQIRADYRRQGLIDTSNQLNWDRFAEMIKANRNGLWTSEQNFGQTARDAA